MMPPVCDCNMYPGHAVGCVSNSPRIEPTSMKIVRHIFVLGATDAGIYDTREDALKAFTQWLDSEKGS